LVFEEGCDESEEGRKSECDEESLDDELLQVQQLREERKV
jgi:hypothetical protein